MLGFNCGPYKTITWQSEPDLDRYGPDCFWDSPEWMRWHKALVDHYGKAQADNIWLSKWAGRGAFGHEFTMVNSSKEFRDFLLAQNLVSQSGDLQTFFTTNQIAQAGVTVVQNTATVAVAASTVLATAAEGAGDAVNGIGQLIKWLPYIVVAGLAVYAYFYFNKSKA